MGSYLAWIKTFRISYNLLEKTRLTYTFNAYGMLKRKKKITVSLVRGICFLLFHLSLIIYVDSLLDFSIQVPKRTYK